MNAQLQFLYETIANEVCAMDRAGIVQQLTCFNGPLPLDFTAGYLANCSTDNLRHMLAAALWRCRTKDSPLLAV